MKEQDFQSKVIKYLKSKGAYVIKTKAQPGTPVGCPDIIALYEGAWLVIECKKSQNSPLRPAQKRTLDKLRQWSHHVYVAYPQNWDAIKAELNICFF